MTEELKLFAGFLINPKLHEVLEKSASWKNRLISPSNDLIEVINDRKHYIGIYLKDRAPTFKTLQQTEKKLKEMLLKIAPDNATDALLLEIFSKLFIL